MTTRESRAKGAASPLDLFRSEAALWAGAVTTVLLWTFGDRWLADFSSPAWYALLFLWIFGAMRWLSFGVVRHADSLAALLGEPYGTLILTLSVISIEVVLISGVMLTGDTTSRARPRTFRLRCHLCV